MIDFDQYAFVGLHIDQATEQMCAKAKEVGDAVRYVFNGVELIAYPETDPAALSAYFSAESDRRHQEYIASPEYAAQQEKWRRETEERRGQRDRLLIVAPDAFTFASCGAAKWHAGLEKNADGYGRAVYDYAALWARLMEAGLGPYAPEAVVMAHLVAHADECSRLADTDIGITGFQYGCAVGILSECWVYGETLRRWHNKETQIGDEGDRANESGGVLNPALLSFGGT